jgi:cubilin
LVTGDNSRAQQLAVLCGREIPGPIRSTGEYMFIRFTSDLSVVGAGFNASFHKSNVTFVISSPLISLSLIHPTHFSMQDMGYKSEDTSLCHLRML